MSIVYMLQWWYGPGWAKQWKQIGTKSGNILKAFSGGIILKTLFSPWKQLVSGSLKDAPLKAKFQAMLDNIVSRFVGFMMRGSLLLAALVSLIFTVVFYSLWAIVWALIPLSPIIGIVLAVLRVGAR